MVQVGSSDRRVPQVLPNGSRKQQVKYAGFNYLDASEVLYSWSLFSFHNVSYLRATFPNPGMVWAWETVVLRGINHSSVTCSRTGVLITGHIITLQIRIATDLPSSQFQRISGRQMDVPMAVKRRSLRGYHRPAPSHGYPCQQDWDIFYFSNNLRLSPLELTCWHNSVNNNVGNQETWTALLSLPGGGWGHLNK